MAAIRKAGKKWLAEVRSKGVYKSKTFLTKQEAQRWALDTEQQIGRNTGVTVSHTLDEAMDRYAKEVSPTKKGHRWEVVRLEKLRRDKIARILLTDLTHDDFDNWIERQTISPASINREITLISSVLRMARVKWKWLSEDPLKDIQRQKGAPPRDRLISEAELQRLLRALKYKEGEPVTAMRQEIAVAMLFALETAMRQGEIWGLEWDRVYLNRRFVKLLDTKNGTKRDVPLSERAVELLKKLIPKNEGRVFSSDQASAGTIFRRAVKEAGIENLTFHDTRHTGITRLARKLDVLDLARMVGHRDLKSLMIYYNATAEDIAKRL